MAVTGETIGRAYIKVLADGQEFEVGLGALMKKAEPTAEKGGQDHAKAYDKGFSKEEEKGFRARLTRLRARLGLQGKEMVKFGNTVGKATGKGARNDFVNMIGSMVGAMPKALGALAQWVSGINKAGSSTSAAAKKMSEAGQGVSGLGKAFGVVGQLVQAAGMLKLVTSAIGMLGAAASLTTGLVLALAGSLGFALVGGLVAVVGAMVPFAAALGVGALAMAGLGKKNSGLKALKADFKDLQKIAAKGVFGKDGAGLKNLEPVLESLKPLVKGVSESLGGLLDSLGKAAKTKGFQDMMKGISDMLPGMVTKIGGIVGKLGLGLGQAFVAAEPLITRFLGFVDDLADKFVAFGKGGKKSGLADFFDSALDSVEIIGPLISDIIEGVGILFGAGKKDGDKLFAGIADKVREIVEWLSSPEGQKSLEKWFEDARKFGEKLGEIIESAVQLIDALDTDESRAKLMLLLDAINWIIDAITWTITKWSDFKTMAALAIGALPAIIRGELATMQGYINIWVQGVQARWDALGAFFSGWAQGIQTRWQTAVTFITSTLPGWVSSVVAWFATIPGRISAVLGDLGGRFQIWLAGVPGKIQSAVGLVAGAFAGLAGKAIARAGSIVKAFGTWVSGLPAKARAIATSVATGFTGLAGKIIAKAGSLASRFASWVSSLAGKARSTAVSIVSAFSGLAGKIIAKAGSIASKFGSWVASLPGKAKTIAGNIASAFSGLAGKIISRAGDIASKFASWGSKAVASAGRVANNIVSKFSGLASRIVNAIGNIVPKIKMPSIPRPTVQAIVKVVKPKTAAGGIFSGAQERIIGEAGPEAVVPLNRALNRVDPAVRALSAFAQGLPQAGGLGAAGPSIGRNIDVGGIVINTPTTDPRAVASEVVNRMTFAAYI
jgi:hypothetical protein